MATTTEKHRIASLLVVLPPWMPDAIEKGSLLALDVSFVQVNLPRGSEDDIWFNSLLDAMPGIEKCIYRAPNSLFIWSWVFKPLY